MSLPIITLSAILLSLCYSDADASGLSGIEKAILDKHNYYRKLHGVPPLHYDANISKFSKKWAEGLALRHGLVHSEKDEYGENLWAGSSTNPKYTVNGKTPVESWYSEIQYYKNYKKEPSSSIKSVAGHYTALVWRGSKKIGIGVAKKVRNGETKYVVVCNYSPPGNVNGVYTKNVPPPHYH